MNLLLGMLVVLLLVFLVAVFIRTIFLDRFRRTRAFMEIKRRRKHLKLVVINPPRKNRE
jgi:hypothetical protein